MALDPISGLEDLANTFINKFIPDADAETKASVQLMLAQASTNTEEAKSTNWFVAGGRPAIMWICASGLGYQFLCFPFLVWASTNFHWISPPALDSGTLGALVTGILGLGTMRTFEKYTNTEGNR